MASEAFVSNLQVVRHLEWPGRVPVLLGDVQFEAWDQNDGVMMPE
jgi:hypothetical protein